MRMNRLVSDPFLWCNSLNPGGGTAQDRMAPGKVPMVWAHTLKVIATQPST